MEREAIDIMSDYLAEGEEWTQEILPGQQGRILSFDNVNWKMTSFNYDNFSLLISIPGDGFEKKPKQRAETLHNPRMRKQRLLNELNPKGLDEIIEADSEAMVLQLLLNRPGKILDKPMESFRSGIANQSGPCSWVFQIWSGNDWTLTLRIIVHEPVITEIAFE